MTLPRVPLSSWPPGPGWEKASSSESDTGSYAAIRDFHPAWDSLSFSSAQVFGGTTCPTQSWSFPKASVSKGLFRASGTIVSGWYAVNCSRNFSSGKSSRVTQTENRYFPRSPFSLNTPSSETHKAFLGACPHSLPFCSVYLPI